MTARCTRAPPCPASTSHTVASRPARDAWPHLLPFLLWPAPPRQARAVWICAYQAAQQSTLSRGLASSASCRCRPWPAARSPRPGGAARRAAPAPARAAAPAAPDAGRPVCGPPAMHDGGTSGGTGGNRMYMRSECKGPAQQHVGGWARAGKLLTRVGGDGVALVVHRARTRMRHERKANHTTQTAPPPADAAAPPAGAAALPAARSVPSARPGGLAAAPTERAAGTTKANSMHLRLGAVQATSRTRRFFRRAARRMRGAAWRRRGVVACMGRKRGRGPNSVARPPERAPYTLGGCASHFRCEGWPGTSVRAGADHNSEAKTARSPQDRSSLDAARALHSLTSVSRMRTTHMSIEGSMAVTQQVRPALAPARATPPAAATSKSCTLMDLGVA